MTTLRNPCTVCGGAHYQSRPVLWRALIDEWQLSPSEAAYVDRQQGECCIRCGANLRSIALATALCAAFGANETLSVFAASPQAAAFKILEINEAGMLHPILVRMP